MAMQLKNSGWKLPLYAGLQFALALLATVATLTVTLDSRDWLELACGGSGGPTAANWSRLAAGSRGLRPLPSWSGLEAGCGSKFASGGRGETPAWTAVNWLLVAASVASCVSLVLLVLGSGLARRRPPARWLPVAFLTFDLICAVLLSITAIIAGISAAHITSLRSSLPVTSTATTVGSTFPPQLAAVVAAAVASAAGAAALPLRRTLLASRAYDVALAAAAGSSSVSSDAMTAVGTVASAARHQSGTISSNASAYQAGECIDDCVCEVVASGGNGAGFDNCGMDSK